MTPSERPAPNAPIASTDQAVPEVDPALVRAAARGEPAAMEALYARFSPMVHAVLLVRVGAGEAEDLTHDAFVRAFRSLGRLEDPRALGAWLAQVARNLAIDHLRRRRRWSLFRRSAAPAPPGASDAALSGAELLSAIRALPDAYHEPLVLRLVAGMKGEQIAAALGMTHGSVRVNLCRGMEMLRERLSGRTCDP